MDKANLYTDRVAAIESAKQKRREALVIRIWYSRAKNTLLYRLAYAPDGCGWSRDEYDGIVWHMSVIVRTVFPSPGKVCRTTYWNGNSNKGISYPTMTHYSAWSVFKNGLTGQRNWRRAWRDPEPQTNYDVIIIGSRFWHYIRHGYAFAFSYHHVSR